MERILSIVILISFRVKKMRVTIDGLAPCSIAAVTATKAIYRQFYLSAASIVKIDQYYDYNCTYGNSPMFGQSPMNLFKGKATDGLNTLSQMGSPWNCFYSAQTPGCVFLQPGWYTVVSYGAGATYSNPTQSVEPSTGTDYFVGYKCQFTITVTPSCPGPKI